MRKQIVGAVLMTCLLVMGCAHSIIKAPPLVLEPNKYSYTFAVPEGWDFSFEQANEFDLRLLLFPKGGDFHSSNSIMYVKEVPGNLTSAVETILTDAKNYSPNLSVVTAPSIPTVSDGSVSVRILTGSKDPRQAKEALAFIDHGEMTVLVVLTTKNTVNWQSDFKAFETVVAGHRYFDCNSKNLAVPCR